MDPTMRRSSPRPVRAAIPSDIQAGALVLEMIARLGLLDQVDRDLALARRDGHTGRGLFALAVLVFMAGPTSGIRPFTERIRGAAGKALAAIGRMRSIPSSAAMSRGLGSIPQNRGRACIDALLLSAPGMQALLSSPHVLHRDAVGRSWHVLDVDPTVVPYRQRALPEGPALPEPVRHSPGEPGYIGHKRGQVRIRMVPILHGGAAVWLGARLLVEEGSTALVAGELVSLALTALRGTKSGAGVVVRYDGEFGSVGAMRATIDAGAELVTRLSRYALLDSPEAATVLASSDWQAVRSGGGGPPREAAELGTYVLKPSARAAGSKEPVTVRVVVTRTPHVGPPTHGIVRNGYQYELFATTLSAEAWPAEDLIVLYFGRAGIENRFAQEDREFALDRTFSKVPAGQEWMNGVGLFLWNLLVCKGVELDPLPKRADRQTLRPTEATLEPRPAPTAAAGPAPASAVSNLSHNPASPSPAADGVPPAKGKARAASAEASLWAITCDVFADIKKRPDWTFDHGRRRLLCPNRMPFKYFNLAPPVGKRLTYQITLYPGITACAGCPMRAGCITASRPGSVKPTRMKAVSRRISVATGQRTQALLDTRAVEPKRDLQPEGPIPLPPPPEYVPAPARHIGTRVVTRPLFLPAESRRSARQALSNLQVEFLLHPAPAKPPRRHRLLARDDNDRQHRRATWAARRSARSNRDRVELHLARDGNFKTFRTLLGVEPK